MTLKILSDVTKCCNSEFDIGILSYIRVHDTS